MSQSGTAPIPHQPIVLLGGFLITAEACQLMRQTLEALSGHDVQLVEVGRLEWLLTVFPFARSRILDRVAIAVRHQAALSPSGRVTLIGHSSGGIMLLGSPPTGATAWCRWFRPCWRARKPWFSRRLGPWWCLRAPLVRQPHRVERWWRRLAG